MHVNSEPVDPKADARLVAIAEGSVPELSMPNVIHAERDISEWCSS
jgi:hypothetical protein